MFDPADETRGPEDRASAPRDATPADLMTLATSTASVGDLQRLVTMPSTAAERYVDLGLIGKGGMGEVRRVRDLLLGRNLAMKVLPSETRVDSVLRFIEEAVVNAGLQHPAVVPVHDIGLLESGQFYFTMQEIRGETLEQRIDDAVAQWGERSDTEAVDTQLELVAALARVCDGVAHAHSRKVLHRDLKPSNLMLGPFGEVLVLDWGLTRIEVGDDGEAAGAEAESFGPSSAVSGSRRSSHATEVGTVVGTPAFMSPEQAGGNPHAISTRSDVYALGACLYNILDGNPPYDGAVTDGVPSVVTGPPVALGARPRRYPNGPRIPPELKAICERAMARDPEDRYQDARLLALELSGWFSGAQRRAEATKTLGRAERARSTARAARRDAERLEQRASDMMMMGTPPFAPVEAKRPVWEIEDEARAKRASAELADVEYAQLVNAALVQAGDSDLAHAMLAEHYHDKHQEAEEAGETAAAAGFELLLREHDAGRYTAYLDAGGRLSLSSNPSGATAVLYRFAEVDRQLRPEFERNLGSTPIRDVELSVGSYVVQLSHDGYLDTTVPVVVERDRDVAVARPREIEPFHIPLPRTEDLADDECYVPAGWFRAGGDPRARNSLPGQTLWLDGFVVSRFPVTIAEYLEFLNDLVDQGRGDEAMEVAPPLPSWEEGKVAAGDRENGVVREADGRFALDGPEERLRWPLTMVNWDACSRYAAWRAERDGVPWRLMSEMEHEKAARGADGRPFPWGHFLDPTFCCMRLSHPNPGRALKTPVDEYPVDQSVYGVRGLAGNVYNWCIDAYSAMGPTVTDSIPTPPDPATVVGPGRDGVHRIIRGGAWREDELSCRAAYRDSPPAIYRDTGLGFRIARPFPA
ncbi:MAG: bifunctional serine/threonine-protein kinase/formylglycine-generating enzyme family protein [Actinomycetota bacterium]